MYARFGKEGLETASKVSEGIKRANLLLSLGTLYVELHADMTARIALRD